MKPTRGRRTPVRQAILNTLLGLLICFVPAPFVSATSIAPPLDYEAPAWRLFENDSNLLDIPFRFVPMQGEAQAPEFLHGTRSETGRFLSSDWRIAPDDRSDRFSVRWHGYWEPGEIECEILLTAKGKATFFLDGKEELRTEDGSIRSVLFLDSRVHELRVDYSHEKGPALAQLEWRIGEEAWKPLVARPERKGTDDQGWNAAYYPGPGSEHEAFTRTDRALDFDWGDDGPFDRLEDAPTLTWKSLNGPAGRTCGEISANREGTLILGLHVPQKNGTTDASVTFTNPLFQLSGGDGNEVAIQFDREASKFSLEKGAAMENGFDVGSLEFFLRAGDAIRFWETGGEFETGAQVAQAIEVAEKAYEESRPKLGGAWSPWDTNTVASGAWWLQVMTETGFPQKVDRNETIRLARFVAPDLAPKLEALPAGENTAPQVDKGIKAALGGLRAIEKRVQENSNGGFDVLFGEGVEQVYSVEGWPFGENRFDIRCGPNEFRITDSGGAFLAFDAAGTIRNFRWDESGNWSGDVELKGPGNLLAGPAETVSQVLWNGSPLMTLREGNRDRARLPDARARFQLILNR